METLSFFINKTNHFPFTDIYALQMKHYRSISKVNTYILYIQSSSYKRLL